jgi:hypothetical protein
MAAASRLDHESSPHALAVQVGIARPTIAAAMPDIDDLRIS